MIYEFDSIDAYMDACVSDPSLRGASPGGVRSELGCTRQYVYQAIKRGLLDLVRVSNGAGVQPILFIPSASVVRYKRESLGRVGRPLGVRQSARMSVDKRLHKVWPNDNC
jgi:hypothetical protein